MTYQELDSRLQGRCKHSRKLGNHTYAKRYEGQISILFHGTYILTFYPNGDFVINTGGWRTVNTKQRINQFLPPSYGVWSYYSRVARAWMLYRDGHIDPLSTISDGMLIHTNSEIESATPFVDWLQMVEQEHRMNVQRSRSEGAKKAAFSRQSVRLLGDYYT